VAASLEPPVIRIRDPFANSTSIRPRAGKPVGAGSAAIRTAAKLDAGCDHRSSCRRHPCGSPGSTRANCMQSIRPR
jgi:hypothetical protein